MSPATEGNIIAFPRDPRTAKRRPHIPFSKGKAMTDDSNDQHNNRPGLSEASAMFLPAELESETGSDPRTVTEWASFLTSAWAQQREADDAITDGASGQEQREAVARLAVCDAFIKAAERRLAKTAPTSPAELALLAIFARGTFDGEYTPTGKDCLAALIGIRDHALRQLPPDEAEAVKAMLPDYVVG